MRGDFSGRRAIGRATSLRQYRLGQSPYWAWRVLEGVFLLGCDMLVPQHSKVARVNVRIIVSGPLEVVLW